MVKNILMGAGITGSGKTGAGITGAGITGAGITGSGNSSMFNLFHESFIQPINASKLFAGVLMILMNVGSKYIEIGLSKSQEQALRNGLGREIVIFCVVFLGTRDLIISIIMTAAFIILSEHLFNEKSKFCIMPSTMKKYAALIDTNDDGIITLVEEKQAMEVLEKAKLLRKKKQQGEFVSFMNNYSNHAMYDENNIS